MHSPMYLWFVVIYLFFCCQVTFIRAIYDGQCLLNCECDVLKSKVKCNGNRWNEIGLKESLLLSTILPFQVLDLSKNKISRLDSFVLNSTALKKLILSDNKIQSISEVAFANLDGLTALDLSGNRLIAVTRSIFSPLKSLERLKLRSNQLTTLSEFIFQDLSHLKTLDISDNPWHCDCNLALFRDWIQKTTIKLQGQAKCNSPLTLSNTPIKRIGSVCSELAALHLIPSNDQVVFAGDSLTLFCLGGSNFSRIEWLWGDDDPRSKFKAVTTETTFSSSNIPESLVRIERLQPEHSGIWMCREVVGGNQTASVSVLVISDSTLYCPSEKTKNNKGEYFWPQTIAGRDVEISCAYDKALVNNGKPNVATYSCNPHGIWENLNTTFCGFTTETTRELEQLAMESLSESKEVSLEKAKQLLNITTQSQTFFEVMNLVFISQVVEQYSKVTTLPGLSRILASVVASMLRAPSALLAEGEKLGKACSRLRSATESLAGDSSVFQSSKSLLAAEKFDVTADSFRGMSCEWRQLQDRRQFLCTVQSSHTVDSAGRDLLAFMQVPGSLFLGLESSIRPLIVSVFPNGHFFPDLVNYNSNHRTGAIVGVNVAGLNINLTEPVMVALSSSVNGEPVWWDSQLGDGKGGWVEGVCLPFKTSSHHVIFHCHRLGYYTIRISSVFKNQQFSIIGQAVLFSGSFVLLLCLFVTIFTHILCHKAIQMPRRTKHSITNTWISIFCLCFNFSFGISSSTQTQFCECIGLALHYFSLTTLLWMVVGGNHMHKRLSKGSSERASDDLPPGVPLHKPILGLYLVGWGVGLIVCGISGAVHLREYAQPQYCFLGSGPALSAVFIPAVILVTIVSVYFVLSLCAIRNNDVNGQLSEGTQGTENVDLELLEEAVTVDRIEQRSANSDTTDCDDIEDTEHTPIIQLKAQVIVLVFFLLTWTSAALGATGSTYPFFAHQQLIANVLYFIFSFCLGTFIMFFYCVARCDVRSQWGAWCRLLENNRRCCRTRNVSDTHAGVAHQPAPAPVTNRPPSVNSGLTGRSSNSNRTKAVIELNNCDSSDITVMHCKPSNTVNLVSMHRQIYRSNNSMPTYHEISSQNNAEAFYNPRQSIVAKKFFKRQRRNRRNELGLRRRGDGGGTSEGEPYQAHPTWRPSAESAVFLSSDMENNSETLPCVQPYGYGSKINNTNIHVGSIPRKRNSQSPKNPNVLSEEDEGKGNEKIMLSRLVIGAEGDDDANIPGTSACLDRVDEEGQPPDCRSIELQCSLGDSSDIPEVEDSFCQKLDGFQLNSDESTERVGSPPHFVTVLDPKYGVVKVTIHDYQQQSHRLSLVSPVSSTNDLPLDCAEEVFRNEKLCSQNENCEASPEDFPIQSSQKQLPNGSLPPTNGGFMNFELKTENSLNGYSPSKKMPCGRRSEPSSPENRFEGPLQHLHRSLPSSPGHLACDAIVTRPSPRLILPPPPDLPLPNSEDESDKESENKRDHWQKPEPPVSPDHRTPTRRPISEDLVQRPDRLMSKRLSLTLPVETAAEENKKETSV